MKTIKSLAMKIWEDESGQGTAEYVLILVGVVALAWVFKDNFTKQFHTQVTKVKDKIGGFIDGGG